MPTFSYIEIHRFLAGLNTEPSDFLFSLRSTVLHSRLTVKSLYATIALYTNNKGVTIMFNNPFIKTSIASSAFHARSASDWVIGLLIATHSAILCALFLILASRAFN